MEIKKKKNPPNNLTKSCKRKTAGGTKFSDFTQHYKAPVIKTL